MSSEFISFGRKCTVVLSCDFVACESLEAAKCAMEPSFISIKPGADPNLQDLLSFWHVPSMHVGVSVWRDGPSLQHKVLDGRPAGSEKRNIW